ncbi:unnamed protein product, partial [Closterium sp. NIES-53]
LVVALDVLELQVLEVLDLEVLVLVFLELAVLEVLVLEVLEAQVLLEEPLSLERLREWAVRWGSPSGGAGRAGAGGTGGTGPAGASAVGLGVGGTGGADAGGATGGTGVGGASRPDGGAGGTGSGGAVTNRARGSGGVTTQPQPSVLHHLPGLPPTATEFPVAGTTPPLLFPLTDQSQPLLLPGSPLPAPAPHTEVTESLTERREPETRASTPVCAHRVARPRALAVPGTHRMALRPSSVPQCVVVSLPPASSLPHVPDPESDLVCTASPNVTRLLAMAVTDPSFESAVASAIIAELVDFAALCRLDYVASATARCSTARLRAALPQLLDSLPAGLPSRHYLVAPPFLLHWDYTCGSWLSPPTVDHMLFLRTDTSLPPFHVLVARRTITLTHSHMVQQVLQRFDFSWSSPQPTPLYTGHSLSAPPLDEFVEPSGPYPELVGCLMYLVTCTRPDLAHLLSLLARFVAPGRHQRVQLFSPVTHTLLGLTTRRITDRHRGTDSASALVLSRGELRWLTYLLTNLGERPRSPPILTKHIALRYFLTRELQQRGQLRLAYVATQANTADVFTKALGSSDHQPYKFDICLCPAPRAPLPGASCASARRAPVARRFLPVVCPERAAVSACRAPRARGGFCPSCVPSARRFLAAARPARLAALRAQRALLPCSPRCLQPVSPAARMRPAARAPCSLRRLLHPRALLPCAPRAPCCHARPARPAALRSQHALLPCASSAPCCPAHPARPAALRAPRILLHSAPLAPCCGAWRLWCARLLPSARTSAAACSAPTPPTTSSSLSLPHLSLCREKGGSLEVKGVAGRDLQHQPPRPPFSSIPLLRVQQWGEGICSTSPPHLLLHPPAAGAAVGGGYGGGGYRFLPVARPGRASVSARRAGALLPCFPSSLPPTSFSLSYFACSSLGGGRGGEGVWGTQKWCWGVAPPAPRCSASSPREEPPPPPPPPFSSIPLLHVQQFGGRRGGEGVRGWRMCFSSSSCRHASSSLTAAPAAVGERVCGWRMCFSSSSCRHSSSLTSLPSSTAPAIPLQGV